MCTERATIQLSVCTCDAFVVSVCIFVFERNTCESSDFKKLLLCFGQSGHVLIKENQYSSVVILQLTLPVYFEYFCLFVWGFLLLFSLCLSESLASSSTDQACSRMQHPRALRASTSGQPHWPAASTPALVRAPATVQRQASYAGMPMSFATQETGSGSRLRPCSTEAGQVTVTAEPGR